MINDSAALAGKFALSEPETAAIKRYDALLLETSTHTNLIARGSIDARWERHYADSFQLWPHVPEAAQTLLDLGSGAGFPGLLLALLGEQRRSRWAGTLVESIGKKARFLTGAADAMALTQTTVVHGRVEEVFHVKHQRFDVITARAVAPLTKLLDWTAPLLASGGVAIFPKGETAEEEIQDAERRWTFQAERVPSMTNAKAQIILIRQPERRL